MAIILYIKVQLALDFFRIFTIYHDVSDRDFQSYIDEAVYRWNTRKASQSERFSDMFSKSIGLIKQWSGIRVGLIAA